MWTPVCQLASNELQQRLTDPSDCSAAADTFVLDVDTSETGVGAVPSQMDAKNPDHVAECIFLKSRDIPRIKP